MTDEQEGTLTLAELERLHIQRTFYRCKGDRAATAKALGIGLRTLYGKLKQYGYQPRYRPPQRVTTKDNGPLTTD